MPHWKTILAYDGAPYKGWQVQPSLPTVQGTLAKAIRHITGEAVLPQGSGRTDAGVHALAQVATFTLSVPIPAANLHRALNRALPPSIRILSVEPVPETFHARHSALKKTYEYHILPGDRICFPMLAPYVWSCRYNLDIQLLNESSGHIFGIHDFTSFAASEPDLASRTIASYALEQPKLQHDSSNVYTVAEAGSASQNVREIFHSSWRQNEELLIYKVTGSGFLHHMVRNLVGTFVEAAAGRISPGSIPAILAAQNRSVAGPTAPAAGLFLVNVEY